ncbi:MAG TPA: TolC family protein, partial [Verrucomicrobiae bacterium]
LRRFWFDCILTGIIAFLLVVCGFFSVGRASAQELSATNDSPVIELKLTDYLQKVLKQNEDIQAQMLETEVGRHKAKSEYGIFEPTLGASIERESNRRTNNVQQQASQNGEAYFAEQNNLLDSSVEQLVPLGGKVRLGYTLSDLNNNINPYGNVFTSTNNPFIKQYMTFVGLTFTQPLLKNGGYSATMAGIRLAALDSGIAFQQYRRQLMLTVYQAESAYWNLYFAQEQIRFFDDSVALAQNVLSDSQQKLKAGQGAELDVMEAQSALAIRNTKRNDAIQNYYDAIGHLRMLTSVIPSPSMGGSSRTTIRAADDPRSTNTPPTYADSFNESVVLNPDYLIQKQKMEQEEVRLGVAQNQMLPELNFKTAYGFNGLGNDTSESWDMIAHRMFPSWSVGLEFSMPLGLNIKGRNLYKAAQLSLHEVYLNVTSTQKQIANTLDIAIQKAQAWRQSIASYQTVVNYNQELLKTQVERLKAGTVEGEKVLEVEANLLDSQQDLASALTQYRRALLEVELSSGCILKNRGIDISRDELKRQTEEFLNGSKSAEAAAWR